MKKAVLLVTNQGRTRETLSAALPPETYELALAEHAQRALTRYSGRSFDLLLLDWPAGGEWDPWGFIAEILGLNPCLPVILLTSRPELREKAAAQGVRALAEKPLDVPELLRVANELVNEPMRERVERLRRRHPDFRHLAPDAVAFREALWQRAIAPFTLTAPERHW